MFPWRVCTAARQSNSQYLIICIDNVIKGGVCVCLSASTQPSSDDSSVCGLWTAVLSVLNSPTTSVGLKISNNPAYSTCNVVGYIPQFDNNKAYSYNRSYLQYITQQTDMN